jgi:hypothetical protein
MHVGVFHGCVAGQLLNTKNAENWSIEDAIQLLPVE